ncbi:hypothetical protein LTR27_001548 [Elasticomyces elasticus]|nr:hypothetical protein LTR27_001548 [Elasticomyces elasticus]
MHLFTLPTQQALSRNLLQYLQRGDWQCDAAQNYQVFEPGNVFWAWVCVRVRDGRIEKDDPLRVFTQAGDYIMKWYLHMSIERFGDAVLSRCRGLIIQTKGGNGRESLPDCEYYATRRVFCGDPAMPHRTTDLRNHNERLYVHGKFPMHANAFTSLRNIVEVQSSDLTCQVHSRMTDQGRHMVADALPAAFESEFAYDQLRFTSDQPGRINDYNFATTRRRFPIYPRTALSNSPLSLCDVPTEVIETKRSSQKDSKSRPESSSPYGAPHSSSSDLTGRNPLGAGCGLIAFFSQAEHQDQRIPPALAEGETGCTALLSRKAVITNEHLSMQPESIVGMPTARSSNDTIPSSSTRMADSGTVSNKNANIKRKRKRDDANDGQREGLSKPGRK